ncbi:DMT family transporter [Mesobaculum littorinae]|uniref:DMT family transporter n=1 Tax=Mesobaculum littorinae TaxID=2486419 RepID=A0A438AKH3_9RHOB|nr:DMT family transporter [Mesobaculum littorinae]
MGRGRAGLIAILVLIGAGWGLGQPLAKIAVSGGHRHVGIVFWHMCVTGAIMGAVMVARRRSLPLGRRHVALYLMVALLGTVLPNAASYQAAVYLPAGLVALLISLVPMFAFPIALAAGLDRFSWGRALGLGLGLCGVLLVTLPETSLPDPAMAGFVPLALIAPVFYALEGNAVAKWGLPELDAVQLLFGATLLGLPVAAGLALGTGTFIDPRPPWGLPELAVVASGAVHAVVYTGYLWLVGRAGSVFAAQVAYLVTASGLVWSMAILGERYSGWIGAALLAMFAGLFLVQPRPRSKLVPRPHDVKL